MLPSLYAAFALVAAAILIFTGPAGRRFFVLAVATGGGASFLVRFIYAGMSSETLTLLQALLFPILVLFTWAALFLIAKVRGR